MSATGDKLKGAANPAMGNAKQAVGDATGNRKLEAEGAGQELKGKVQSTTGKAKDVVKDAVDRA